SRGGGLVLDGKSWGTAPDPLNPGAIRATLRGPDSFGHIGWMIRLSGVFGAVARVPPPGLLNAVFSLGIGRVVQ
ncbi:hypothetical protein, partial [Bradyrhizobium guangdongense]|uniref:hypothetical protein n=1 Tax=Bradyrhizobium guangdongense TaxID=1325090 RepID=UPI001AECA3EE